MPYVKFGVEEMYLGRRLAVELNRYGWEQEHDFKRIVYKDNGGGGLEVSVAHHHIFKNVLNDRFGLVYVRRREIKGAEDVTEETILNMYRNTTSYRPSDQWFIYMLDNYYGEKSEDGKALSHVFKTSGDTVNESLDVETHNGVFRSNTNQSVITGLHYRNWLNKNHYDNSTEPYRVNYRRTNYWEDSRLRVEGSVDENSIFLVIQADVTPNFGGNDISSVPLFFGRIKSYKEYDKPEWRGSVGMFGGSVSTHSTIKPFVMPKNRGNYSQHLGNGITDIVMKEDRYGNRYFSHFISALTTPKEIPPELYYEGSLNERGWSHKDSHVYNYRVNPSEYDGYVHTSPMYVYGRTAIGKYGELRNVLATNPVSLIDGEEMVLGDRCLGYVKKYVYKIVNAPFTPLTLTSIGYNTVQPPFRPLGVCLLKEEVRF